MHWDGLCKSSHNILNESRAVLVGMGPSAAAQISSYSFYHEDIQVQWRLLCETGNFLWVVWSEDLTRPWVLRCVWFSGFLSV